MNASDARKAHKILDDLIKGNMVLDEEREFLRSALPEQPRQMTLEEIHVMVDDYYSNESDERGYLPVGGKHVRPWLNELREQLYGLVQAQEDERKLTFIDAEPAKPAHPEFLETEADYENAPEGTIVACAGSLPCHKFHSKWSSVDFCGMKDDKGMSRACRRVLRWGWRK